MTQEAVRNRLNKYIDEKGVKPISIGRKLDIPNYLISKFRKAKRELWQANLEKMDEFLTNENY